MTLRDLFKTPWLNLGRHGVRSALSGVGVMVGILTIVTMVSLGIGVQRDVARSFERIGLETIEVHPVTEERTVFDQFAEPKRTVLITPELVEELRARDDTSDVHPRVLVARNMRVYLQMGGQVVEVRVRESPWHDVTEEPFARSPELVAGRDVEPDGRGDIVVSTRTLKRLGYEAQAWDALLGQEVSLLLKAPRGDAQRFDLCIVGVVDTFQGTRYPGAYVGLGDILDLNAWWYNEPDILERQGYDELVVRAVSLNDAAQIVDLIQARGFRVESLKETLEMVNRATTILQTMLGSVGGLALFVATIGIANTMVMAVYERTREIGILKAIGASPRQIRLLFVVEAAMIGLLGGVVGTLGGWLLGLVLNRAILAYLHAQEIPMESTFFVVTGGLVALALTFATVAGLLAGLYPAARAARLDPLEALRRA